MAYAATLCPRSTTEFAVVSFFILSVIYDLYAYLGNSDAIHFAFKPARGDRAPIAAVGRHRREAPEAIQFVRAPYKSRNPDVASLGGENQIFTWASPGSQHVDFAVRRPAIPS